MKKLIIEINKISLEVDNDGLGVSNAKSHMGGMSIYLLGKLIESASYWLISSSFFSPTRWQGFPTQAQIVGVSNWWEDIKWSALWDLST